MAFHHISLLETKEPLDYYEEISESKPLYKEILFGSKEKKSKLYNIILKRYELYSNMSLSLESIDEYSIFEKEEKDALLHCYNGRTKKITALKKDIIDAQNDFFQSKCTYCGIGGISSMDHYLPKEQYPEYSVHSYNLIPCCSFCNEKKLEAFLDEFGTRKIFNPYFDKLYKEPVIVCDIIQSNNIPTYSLRSLVPANTVYSNHLTRLNLIERYEAEIPRIITTILGDMRDIYNEFDTSNVTNIINILNNRLLRTEKEQGINSLNAVAYRAILANEFLLEQHYIEEYLPSK